MRLTCTICLLLLFLFSCTKNGTQKDTPPLAIPLNNVDISTATDSIEGGNSTLSFTQTPEGHVTFRAKTGDTRVIPYPYWSIIFSPKNAEWDISPFKSVKISFDENNSAPREGLVLTLTYNIKGFTDTSKGITFAQYSYDIKKLNSDITIPLKDFVIPQWWYTLNKISSKDIEKLPKSFSHFSFGNADLKGSSPYTVKIKSIEFK